MAKLITPGSSDTHVIADEAHERQCYLVDGLARRMREALPHVSFLSFTGTKLRAAWPSGRWA